MFVPAPQGARISAKTAGPLLPIGDSGALPCFVRVVLRLRADSNSDSILNGERGFG
jgi:hypothetical protein